MYTLMEKKYKEVLQEIIPLLAERVFPCWHVTPVFKVEDFADEDYVSLSIEYDGRPSDEPKDVALHRHEAMDLAAAFIAGYFSAKGINMWGEWKEEKDVYLYFESNEISLTHTPGESVCVGQTAGTLEDFLNYMKKDWTERGMNTQNLPKIRNDSNQA